MHTDLIQSFGLPGAVAVVTGAASGIGRETASVLAKAGASVVLADIADEGLAETARRVEAEGGRALAVRTDVSRRDEVEALADIAVQRLGKVDVWANVAGVSLQGAILDTREADLDRAIAVNMKGVYWGCAAAGRVMKPQGRGAIVNVSSGGGDTALAGISAYGMTKAAVNLLTRTCALEFGSFGVRVNAVAPGWIETPMGSRLFVGSDGEINQQKRDAVIQSQVLDSALGIAGTPWDIAMAILYLASDASRFVTGHLLRANGGKSI